MSAIVNTVTGEIIERPTHEEARRTTEQIKLLAGSIADSIDRLVIRIREAQASGVHEVLGYRSWTEYVSTEFAGVLPRLDRVPRMALTATLAETGMSTRAIASIAGVSHETVSQDIKSAPVRNLTPVAEVAPAPSPTPEPALIRLDADPAGEVTKATEAADRGDTAPRPSRPQVTGIDGKRYTPPVAKPSRTPEVQNAEENSIHLARHILGLLSFEHPHMRAHRIKEWCIGKDAVSPSQRPYVTPEHMRTAAAGLLALADEWSDQ